MSKIVKIDEHMSGLYTGNYLELDPVTTSLYVTALLEDYDRRMKSNESNKPKINPYRDKLYIRAKNGKYAEVPMSIQQEAIVKYINSNGEIADNNDESSGIDVMYHLTLCIIVILAVMYTIKLYRK